MYTDYKILLMFKNYSCIYNHKGYGCNYIYASIKDQSSEGKLIEIFFFVEICDSPYVFRENLERKKALCVYFSEVVHSLLNVIIEVEV